MLLFLQTFVLHNVAALQGVSYNHVELNFYVNGEPLNCPVTGIRGTVFPVIYGKKFLIVVVFYKCISYSKRIH